jgi:hypothetical protein
MSNYYYSYFKELIKNQVLIIIKMIFLWTLPYYSLTQPSAALKKDRIATCHPSSLNSPNKKPDRQTPLRHFWFKTLIPGR